MVEIHDLPISQFQSDIAAANAYFDLGIAAIREWQADFERDLEQITAMWYGVSS